MSFGRFMWSVAVVATLSFWAGFYCALVLVANGTIQP